MVSLINTLAMATRTVRTRPHHDGMLALIHRRVVELRDVVADTPQRYGDGLHETLCVRILVS